MREKSVKNYISSRFERLKSRRKFQILPPGYARDFAHPINDNPRPPLKNLKKIILLLSFGAILGAAYFVIGSLLF